MSLLEARGVAAIFEPQRLQVARQLRKQTQAALAKRLEVTGAAVSQWESGESSPKPSTLLEIARFLDFPIRFFGSEGTPIPRLESSDAFFRSLRRSRPLDREAAMAHASLIDSLVRVLGRHALLPTLDIPDRRVVTDAAGHDIEAVADAVRRAWGLDDEPIENMVRELERHGAIAVRLHLADDVDAFSWFGSQRPIVILGADKGSKNRSRFDAAHELGHLTMHGHRPEAGNKELERQAHRFAGAFLLPADQLVGEWPSGRLNWGNLLRLKQRWQMSLAALLYRAKDLDLLSPTAYESAVKYMSRAGWRKEEPGDLGRPERPVLIRRAVRALAQVGITLDHIADEASIRPQDLQEYVGDPPGGRVPVEL